MKVWIDDEIYDTHRIVRLNKEAHSGFEFLGDLSEDEMNAFLRKLNPKLDVPKHLKMLDYFGYLHLFITLVKEKK